MCGITGHWGHHGQALDHASFAAFTNSLAHRGPDGVGLRQFPVDRLWLGHRRLAIIDVSERARQPMSYAAGRYWLTYNGEIYNFVELRCELAQLGHRFVSDSDSEVILAAYAQWGEACQERFNGMWALAIWDDRDKRLFLSRDRFAIKPLYYADVNGTFCFASELKSFLWLDWCDGTFDPAVLLATLHHPSGQEAVPATLLPRVTRLLGGHCLAVTAAGMRVRRWWHTPDHLPEVPADLPGQVAQFRDALLDACRIRLRSDVPIATALSGGLDSSAIACAIAELRRRRTLDHLPADWQRAFIACFPGTGLDEQDYARAVVEATGLQPYYHTIDGDEIAQHIETVVHDMETIFNNPLVGAWAIYREMRRHGIRVSLDGHGADELLGGYHYFVDAALDALCGIGFRWGRYRDLHQVRRGLTGGTNIAQSGEALAPRGLRHDVRVSAKRAADRLGWLAPLRARFRQPRAPLLPPLDQPAPSLDPPAGASVLARMQYQWFSAGLLPTFLTCMDRASMAHGIEVRMPFLDWRVVTLGMALPDASKIGGGYTKRILRLATAGLMPDPVRLRTQKIHFSSPIGEWSRGALKPWFLDLAASQAFRQSPVWHGQAARAAVEHAVTGAATIHPVWPLINAHVLQCGFQARRAEIYRTWQADRINVPGDAG